MFYRSNGFEPFVDISTAMVLLPWPQVMSIADQLGDSRAIPTLLIVGAPPIAIVNINGDY